MLQFCSGYRKEHSLQREYARFIKGLDPYRGESVFTALKDYTDHVSLGLSLEEDGKQRLYKKDLWFE